MHVSTALDKPNKGDTKNSRCYSFNALAYRYTPS